MKHEIDRDHMGRFAAGNSGGPGRPKRQAEEDYLQTLSERVPLALWAEIVDKAASDAAAGDAKARDWLSKYLMPQPGAGESSMGQPLVIEFSEATRDQLGLVDPAEEDDSVGCEIERRKGGPTHD